MISEHPAADESGDYPTSFKLQELLVSRLSEGRIHMRLYEILQHLVLYGSVYGKIFWYSRQVSTQQWDYETLDIIEGSERLYDCPIVQLIPLGKLLPDWTATHNDVQRHRGIGHCVDKTYEHIMEQFERGVYNLNKAEFVSRWERTAGDDSADEYSSVDPDQSYFQEGPLKFTVWEWHGSVPTDEGQRECLCSIVTEREAQTPEDGVMVRLTEGPVLWSGHRPFVAAHYIPLPGPLGMGALESNLDLIHSISQFLSQSQDNARLTANAQLIVRRGSSTARQIGTESDAVFPGKVWTVDDPSDIQPFPALQFPQNEVNFLIDYLNGMLERRTSVNDMSLGMASGGRTATEAHMLQESAVTPFSVRTDLFARSFLEPLGKIALAMLQQFVLEEQIITIRGSGGSSVPLIVTPREIQSGKYKVAATLTRQDSTRLAKAQSIERALPTLAKFQPLLAGEGVEVSFSELLKRYLDLIGVDGAERVLTRSPAKSGPPQPGFEETGGAQTQPKPLVENGGPMGSEPTDANALAQMLQKQSRTA